MKEERETLIKENLSSKKNLWHKTWNIKTKSKNNRNRERRISAQRPKKKNIFSKIIEKSFPNLRRRLL